MTRRFTDVSRPRARCTLGEVLAVAICVALALIVAAIAFVLYLTVPSWAHDPARPDLDSWFNSLRSPATGGSCCSFVDGTVLLDADWESKNGHYRVQIEGEWYDVPPDTVLTTPNRYGPAVVWRYRNPNNEEVTRPWVIRCFIPGAGT